MNFVSGSAFQGWTFDTVAQDVHLEVKTMEFIPYAGWRVLAPGKRAAFYLKTGAGFGYASAERVVEQYINGVREYENAMAVSNGSKGYWAFMGQGDMEIILFDQVTLTATGGYRMANAGILTGQVNGNSSLTGRYPLIEEGETQMKTSGGKEMSFDFSGLYFLLGLAFRI